MWPSSPVSEWLLHNLYSPRNHNTRQRPTTKHLITSKAKWISWTHKNIVSMDAFYIRRNHLSFHINVSHLIRVLKNFEEVEGFVLTTFTSNLPSLAWSKLERMFSAEATITKLQGAFVSVAEDHIFLELRIFTNPKKYISVWVEVGFVRRKQVNGVEAFF